MLSIKRVSPEQIAQEIDGIYRAIKEPLDKEPEGLKDELEVRGQWLARSAELLADTQIILDKKRGEVAEKHIGSEESWNLIKSIIEAECSTEKRLYTLTERLNATLVHQMDEIRTLLSFAKAQLPSNFTPKEQNPF